MADQDLVRDRTARARTRPGRLASVDRYLVVREASLLSDPARGDCPVVDVGFGDSPITTQQLFESVRTIAPVSRVVGYEVDADRAARAARTAGQIGIDFRHGGFREVAGLSPRARVIRVMNVLRSYPPEAVTPIRELMGEGLVEGGLLIEGTSDTDGHVLTAFLLRRTAQGLRNEGLLLFTDFARGFNPWLFRDYLPRDLRRAIPPGSALHQWLLAWEQCWARVREDGARTAPELFLQSVQAFCLDRGDVDPCGDLGNGFARWIVPA